MNSLKNKTLSKPYLLKIKGEPMEYDVHFSLNGFLRITADSNEQAMEIAETQLTKAIPSLEDSTKTGLGIEIIEAVDSE